MTPEGIRACQLNGKKGGRPKGRGRDMAELTAQAAKYCPEALDTLVYGMRHAENEANRYHCCREILDRGMGKPTHANDRAAGQLMDMLQVITGVPRPLPEPDEIEGEIIDHQ